MKISIEKGYFNNSARIRPEGFWADVVNVWQSRELGSEEMREPEISWSSGGKDGTVSDIQCANNLIEALKKAIEIAEEWRAKR